MQKRREASVARQAAGADMPPRTQLGNAAGRVLQDGVVRRIRGEDDGFGERHIVLDQQGQQIGELGIAREFRNPPDAGTYKRKCESEPSPEKLAVRRFSSTTDQTPPPPPAGSKPTRGHIGQDKPGRSETR